MGSKVFVVHGHDVAAKHEAARFLERLVGPERVTILAEQASGGASTLIEKLERVSAEAGYAVVLFTGDDEGRAQGGGDLKPRARQNVVLELGFFIGRLGRDRVSMLYEPEVEIPSDVHGVAYIERDARGAWKTELARELRAAGFDVDLNRAF